MVSNAFPKRTRSIAQLVANVELDVEALCQPIRPCDLASCRGTCCHDGVYLSGEEAGVIRDLVRERKSELRQLGADLPERVIVYGSFRDLASGPKTAVRPAPMRQNAEDYPVHFPDTSCVFLLEDARCALQVLALSREEDPWFYKPFTCWIHPLSFSAGPSGEAVLTLHTPATDPHTFPDYPGFSSQTPCGKICQSGEGRPAHEVLEAELGQLGKMGDRDLIAEIRSAIAPGN